MRLLYSLLILFISCNSVETNTEQYNLSSDFSKENIDFKSGDIIFQSSTSGQSLAIQLATHSKYSHVGVIFEKKGELYVCEAVQPVKITPLQKFIERGDNQHYVVKRLIDSEKLVTTDAIQKMKQYGEKQIGKNYDLYFEWSDDKIYCSELVWKIYKEALDIEIGKLQKLGEFDLSHPAVKEKLKERYADKIPYEESVISPAAIFESPMLETVSSNKKSPLE
jgi:hypothetical protein